MSHTQKIKSTCGLCAVGCGILVHLHDKRIVKIEGDPDNPLNKGKLCQKGMASLEYLFHPDRLTVPLKQKGNKGSDQWEKISWDEALETIASRLNEIKNQFGPEFVAFIHGAAKGLQDSYIARLAYAFGSPNVGWQGHVCFVPRVLASQLTYGFYAIPDYDYPPSCIIVWGKNLSSTLHHAYHRVKKAVQNGSKLIVIDPRPVHKAQKPDVWMQIRPGTDLALALGMIHVIINEKLFDSQFVEKWTFGFSFLKNSVMPFTPEKVQAITWIPAAKIKESARLYAKCRPAVIQWGNPIDHGLNNFQTARAICILRAITGNIGIPGGEIQPLKTPMHGRRSLELERWDKISPDTFKKNLNQNLHIIPKIKYIQPQCITKAILDKVPYEIRGAYIQGANPLLTYPNAQEAYRAMKKLHFLAVADMFMTPTTALADIVLPAASYLEYDSIVMSPYSYPITSIQQKILRTGTCQSDYEILRDLSYKLGLDDCFWSTEEECLDYCLKPAGLTFAEFRKRGLLHGKKGFRKFEKEGFSTNTGKVELFSKQLKDWGFDPLPKYIEPPNSCYCDPQMVDSFPLILTTWKHDPYRHSGGRQIQSLRKRQPEPLVWINPRTASKYGIKNDEWIYIETKKGKILQKTRLTEDIDHRVIGVDYGWWFPEKDPQQLYEWDKSNMNILTSCSPPYGPEMGTTNLRGVGCDIKKIKN